MPLTPRQFKNLQNTDDPQIQRRFLFLYNYPNLKTALDDPTLNSFGERMGQIYQLNPDQAKIIAKTIMLLLTGELPPQNIATSLSQLLTVTDEIKQKIIVHIQTEIISPLNYDLMQAYKEFPQIQKEFMESQQPAADSSRPAAYSQQQLATHNSQPIAPAPENLPVTQPTANSLQQVAEDRLPPAALAQPATHNPQPVTRNPQLIAPTPENLPTAYDQPVTRNPQPIQDIRFLAKKNPAILDQYITTNYLIESGSGKPISPTVKNWLLDYVRIAGSGSHSNLDRGRYLIKSPNAKNLTEDERNLVNKIIESYDSGSPLTVDINTGLLLLPNKRNSNFPAQRTNDVHTFQIMPVSFGNIVDLQDY